MPLPHSVQNAFLDLNKKLVYRNFRSTEPLILGNTENITPAKNSWFLPQMDKFSVKKEGEKRLIPEYQRIGKL